MKKKKKPAAKELKRRAKIARSLRRYHNDVRAVMKATDTKWREAQKLIPASVRRPTGKGRVTRDEIVGAAKERHAIEREAYDVELQGIEEEGIAGVKVSVTYQDLMDYFVMAGRQQSVIRIETAFYSHPKEKVESEERGAEIYRALGAAGDSHRPNYKGELRNVGIHTRYWRIRKTFTLTYTRDGWLLTD